jgi:hypothetical protein
VNGEERGGVWVNECLRVGMVAFWHAKGMALCFPPQSKTSWRFFIDLNVAINGRFLAKNVELKKMS